MQISLRKAREVCKDIERYAAENPVKTSLVVSAADSEAAADPSSVVRHGLDEVRRKIELVAKLNGVLAALRIDIGAANATAGIDALLTKAANARRMLKLYEAVVNAPEAERPSVVESMLQRANRSFQDPAQPRYSIEDVTVNLVTEELREMARNKIASIRRMIEALDEQRLALNNITKIEIGSNDEQFLQELRII